jgi:ribosome-binding protein aMBF1 (putative translation factor)
MDLDMEFIRAARKPIGERTKREQDLLGKGASGKRMVYPPCDVDLCFGEVLRARRMGLGLSLPQVAEYTGLNSEYLRQIEKGERVPRTRVLMMFALALDLDMSGFYRLVADRLESNGD